MGGVFGEETAMMELSMKVCETKDRRFRYLEVVPELFGDLFFNLGKINVEGLPKDVKVQAMAYDPLLDVVVLRLWSSEFEAVDNYKDIPYCEGVYVTRVDNCT